MARPSKPWFRESKGTWYATMEGRKLSLGVKGRENEKEAVMAWHRLFANGTPEPMAEPTPEPITTASARTSFLPARWRSPGEEKEEVVIDQPNPTTYAEQDAPPRRSDILGGYSGRLGGVSACQPHSRTEMFAGKHLTPVVGGGWEKPSDLDLSSLRVSDPEITLQFLLDGTPKP